MAKGSVKFNKELCKGCELCIKVCPVKILKIDHDEINSKGYHPATIVDEEKCTGCANCATMCPDIAISVYRA